MNILEVSPYNHFTVTFCLGPRDKAAKPTTRHTGSQNCCLIRKDIGVRNIGKGRGRGIVKGFIRSAVGVKVRAIIKSVKGRV